MSKSKRSIKGWSNNIGYYIEAIGEGDKQEVHYYFVDDGTGQSKEVTRDDLIAMGASVAKVVHDFAQIDRSRG